VCDRTHHSFKLNKPALVDAFNATAGAWQSFPEVEKEKTGIFVRPTVNQAKKSDEIDTWMLSPLVDNYGRFVSNVNVNRDGKTALAETGMVSGFDATYSTTTPFCGPAQSYPKGWKEKEAILFVVNDTLGNYEKTRSALTSLMNVSKAIRSSISKIEQGNGREAMRELADLAWVIHNQNSSTKHYSYMVVKILLFGGWILIAVVLYSLLSLLTDRYGHASWLKRFHSKYD